MAWVGAVREWLQLGLRLGDRFFVLIRDPALSIDLQSPAAGRGLVVQPKRSTENPIVHWESFRELGCSLAPVIRRLGLPVPGGLDAAFPPSLAPGLAAEEQRRIVEICGREMTALRMITLTRFQDVVPRPRPMDVPQSSGNGHA